MPRKEQFNLGFHPGVYGPGNDWTLATIAFPQAVRSDIIEVRAQRSAGKYHYRIVDDDGITYASNLKDSDLPLTLGKLIALIDGASGTGYDDWPAGLTSVFRDYNLENSLDDDPETFVDSVIVTSRYYVELERWYRDEAEEWLDTQRAKRAEQKEEMNKVRKVLGDFVERKDSKGSSID